MQLTGRDRLIVALDVPGVSEAMGLVEQLDTVRCFKIGWQLFMSGVMSGDLRRLLELLSGKGANIFVDLKVPGDIDNTVAAVVDVCIELRIVKFLTLSESMPTKAIAAAKIAKVTKHSEFPKLLTVPFVSSLDATDLQGIHGASTTLNDFILNRATAALRAGCDGVIASGDAIRLCRTQFGPDLLIVSPGIRPAGSSADDHKRLTTPADAIRSGSDYLVVGRPIVRSPNPGDAAGRIMAEIDEAFHALRPPKNGGVSTVS